MSTKESLESFQFPLGIERDIENARVLIEEHPWRDNPQKYRKAAETILRRILTVDPQNETAKGLLAKAEVSEPEVRPVRPVVVAELLSPPPVPPRARPAEDELSFVVPAPKQRPEKTARKSPVAGLLGFAGVCVFGGVLIFGFLSNRFQSQRAPQPRAAATVTDRISLPAAALVPESTLVSVQVPEPAPVTVPELPSSPPVEANNAAPAIVEVKATPLPVAPMQTGTLAVSSPTTVDIYLGDQFLGSAPTTLELPAGNQKLEYRHQDTRKIVTQVIRPNETTTTMVTFDVPVQINAKPWAQVFVDGSQRKPLGQTPLSDVLVPIGSVLVFENPNFTGKRYRVTGKETEIRVTFP